MYDLDGIGPKIRAIYNTLQDWTQTTANLLLTRVDATISSAVTAANNAKTSADTAVAGVQKPPTAGGIIGPIVSNTGIQTIASSDRAHLGVEFSAACSVYDTWVNLVNYTGAGVLELAVLYQIDNSSDRDAQLEIVIDGNSAYLSDADIFKTSADDDKGAAIVGSVNVDGVAFGSVKFNTSLVIRAKKTENAAGTVNVGGRARYQTWS